MLEAGLVRSKNTTEILTKNVCLYAIACTMYLVVGYNIMYVDNASGSWLPSFGSLIGTQGEGADHSLESDFFFQVVFVATAMSVVSGAVAERMKLWAFLIFTVVLTGFIYPMEGYWTWGGGFLSEAGFSDFAGSGIVHMAGAAAALSGVILLGARKVNTVKMVRLTLSRFEHASSNSRYLHPLVRLVRFQRRFSANGF